MNGSPPSVDPPPIDPPAIDPPPIDGGVGVIAALDLGTNSFHLVVARHRGAQRFEVIAREKEMIRLGHGATDMKQLSPDAMERAVESITRMAQIAKSHKAEHLRAVATSATREAANADEFLKLVRDRTAVEIEVISGIEEARLIYLGVLQAVPVFTQRCLVVDIGGGSTELLIGERAEMLTARSFKLGAVRLTDRFFPGGQVNSDSISDCREYIRSVLVHFDNECAEYGYETAVASSGTAETLARMIQARRGGPSLRTYNKMEFTRAELKEVTEAICAATDSSTRSRLAGLEASRADIAVAGALILEQIAERYEIEVITFSEAALREGVMVETAQRLETVSGQPHIERTELATSGTRDVAHRSVLHLRDRCDHDAPHSDQVARLALNLFDELVRKGLITAQGRDRELLEFGALLANVGLVVAHSKHHIHSYYVIRNSELTGLTDHEIDLIAQIARYHRKSHPKSSHLEFAALTPADQDRVRALSGILRIAIGLDRTHRSHVAGIQVHTAEQETDLRPTLVITAIAATADTELDLEIYAANQRRELLGEVLNLPVTITRDF
jgi:exopolyphosphatase / guanosine-5'-triphosphate,3'-diphosphate pyrophosphatase